MSPKNFLDQLSSHLIDKLPLKESQIALNRIGLYSKRNFVLEYVSKIKGDFLIKNGEGNC